MVLNYFKQLPHPWNIVAWVGVVIVVFVICLILTKLNKIIFKRVMEKNNALHLMFLQHLISVLIVIGFIVLVISSFAGVKTVWTTIFGGTAIVSAVVAFAAQDVIKDVIAGIMISLHRPFEVGDRIVLEDGTAGIVEEMTLRHVVLIGVESLRIIVPNSIINSKKLSNLSFNSKTRSVIFKFPVGYDSDVEQVKKIIYDAIKESDRTVDGFIDKEGNSHYGEVYFMNVEASALIMQVTVYYLPTSRTELVIDDINSRVRKALVENNIEIPYNYVNVIEKTEESEEKPKKAKSKRK